MVADDALTAVAVAPMLATALMVAVADADALAVPDRLAMPAAVAVAVLEADPLAVADAISDPVAVPELVAVPVAVAFRPSVSVAVPVDVPPAVPRLTIAPGARGMLQDRGCKYPYGAPLVASMAQSRFRSDPDMPHRARSTLPAVMPPMVRMGCPPNRTPEPTSISRPSRSRAPT